ncbi:hypothetical protein [Alteromonas gracilis]|uniref:hypothetical protein n=1 Tax=Alteromonas gracilis TaxID=1479524 RepID=UPI0030CAA6AE
MFQKAKTKSSKPSFLTRIGAGHCAMIVALVIAIFLNVASFAAKAQSHEAGDTSSENTSLNAQIEDLKKALINLNRDLFILEEDLLFPSSTQVAVYLSLDVGVYFQLDAVELVIDDETATYYLYTERQVNALKRGGVQRLYMGNINQGAHELTAFFIGIGPEKRPYKRAVTLTFDKDEDAQAVELRITDSTAKHQPEFTATVI